MRKAIALAACLLASAAVAQPMPFPAPERGRPAPLRIQTQLQLTVPLRDAGDPAAQLAQTESIRRSLYEMANRECRTLREVFGGDCRLVTVNVTSSVQQRSMSGIPVDSFMSNGNATYEITAPGGTPL